MFSLIVIAAACGGGSLDAAAEADEPVEQVGTAPPVQSDGPLAEGPASEPAPVVVAGGGAGVVPTPIEPAGIEACMRVPVLARHAGALRSAREFGALPDDDKDDTAEIQRALDTLEPGDTLQFAPGRYLTNKQLLVRRRGLTLKGSDTTLHATNPDSLALHIQADDTTVTAITFTAVTAGRRDAPQHHRIAVTADTRNGYRTVKNTVIVANRIVAAGAPGSSTANSSSASGIFLQNAEGFLVAENTIARTLADGIHITAGSRKGRVLDNVLRENGDDMIAVVSYADWGTAAENSAGRLLADWGRRVDQRLGRNILIAGNQISSPYWGRGISVVGGRSITIARNTLTNLPRAAGILLAREANYQTFGVDDVWVQDNVLRDVQNKSPSYDGGGKFSPAARTGHGAIEIHAALFDDEAANPTLRDELAVRNVLVRGNRVEHSAVAAVRAGVTMGGQVRSSGHSRSVQNGWIRALTLENNRFDDGVREPIRLLGGRTSAYCHANSRDGSAYDGAGCQGAVEAIRGATMRCGSDGRVL